MSLEDQIRKLIAVNKQAPTLLQRPEKINEDPTEPTRTICGITFPAHYENGIVVGHYSVSEVYQYMIPFMYCRPLPVHGCEALFLSDPIDGSMPPQQTVTDRDLPLTWQRNHPEFNPDDPKTWDSLFGPGGYVDREVRYVNCPRGEDGIIIPCHSEEWIREFCDIVRQFYAARCGFIVAQTGACCSPDGEFGGFGCDVTNSTGCVGTFYAGQSCEDIDNNNCGLAPNPIQQNDQTKKPRS